jgi:hypothetical protein
MLRTERRGVSVENGISQYNAENGMSRCSAENGMWC